MEKNSPGATEHTVFVVDVEKETFEKGFKEGLWIWEHLS